MTKTARSFFRKIAHYRLIGKIADFVVEIRHGELPSTVTPDLGEFIDSRGNRITLSSGLRDWLKPDWRSMFGPPTAGEGGVPLVPEATALASRRSVEEALRFLQMTGFELTGKKVVEIGCHDGTRSFALAGLGAAGVTATDIPEYYLNQKEHTTLSDDEIESGRQSQMLRFTAGAEVCERVFGWQGLQTCVTFREDDICVSKLPDAEYDLVVSWEVLEHVERPEDLFGSIARILRPGGVSFHEYNPFFSMNGGHSLCTLDFLWGHARLSTDDFSRYLHELRPHEEEMAMRFFTKNLNRMSHAELRRHVGEAGLELLAFLPWYDRSDERHLDRETLESVQALHPTVTAEDLMARDVWVLLRKPEPV